LSVHSTSRCTLGGVECPAAFEPVDQRHWTKEKAWHEERSISQSRW
jgi:hypothetical protein